MSTVVEISTGATVPVSVTLMDDGEPALGAALTYQVSRIVGGAVEILDRGDGWNAHLLRRN